MFVDSWSHDSADWAALYATRNESVGLKAYALLSHLIFVPVVVRSVHHRNWFSAVINVVCVVVSLMYHACLATDACLGTTVERARAHDRLTATIDIISFCSYFLEPASAYVQAVVPLQLLVVGLAQSARPYSSYPVAVALVVVGVGFVTRALLVADTPPAADAPRRRRRIFWPALLGAVVCGCIAVAFFLIDSETSALHSSWHVFAGAAMLLGLEATHGDDRRRPRRKTTRAYPLAL